MNDLKQTLLGCLVFRSVIKRNMHVKAHYAIVRLVLNQGL